MALPVTTVASGGLAVVDVTATTPKLGLPVTETTRGIPVTKVTAPKPGLAVTYGTFVEWPPAGPAAGSRATLDGVADPNVVLSDGNLTVTRNNTSVIGVGGRSASLKNTGKYYFEVTVGVTHGLQDCVAVAPAATSYPNILASTFNSCIVAFTGTAPIWFNGANTGKALGTAIVAGNVVGVAADMDTKKVWFRKNGGLWNGLAAGSEDPAAGLGGIAVTAVAHAPAIVFGGTGSVINDVMTANFGMSAFGFAVPVGFNSGWLV